MHIDTLGMKIWRRLFRTCSYGCGITMMILIFTPLYLHTFSVPLMLAVSIKLLKMRLNSVLKPSIGKIIQAMIPLSIIKSKN